MVRVKICGIRRLEDALLAARLGADGIGLLVGQRHPSADFIDAALAAQIARSLPPLVSSVLVSHLEEVPALCALIDQVQPQVLQIHSPMPAEAIRSLRCRYPQLKLIKALHPDGTDLGRQLGELEAVVDGWVADSCNPATGQVGGTGLVHDWALSAQLVATAQRPVLLAGGLTPANVRKAIRKVQPWGVDVNSGVKGSDGFKDPQRLRLFLEQARQL